MVLQALIFLRFVTRGTAKVTSGQALLFVTFCAKKIQKKARHCLNFDRLMTSKMKVKTAILPAVIVTTSPL
ncbi:hypothetical protein SD53_11250 [Rheinheimera mesophila]|nr:hypothetical protein SD53_11250 [Rheinheimera mesophila]